MPQAFSAEKLIATIEALGARIAERFPGSGLGLVAGDLLEVARHAAARARAIRRPHVALRILAYGLVSLIAGILLLLVAFARFRLKEDWWDQMQGIEASIGTMVFLGAACLYVMSLETRWKRRKALRLVHELRVLAHIVDLHQLTKDPERAFGLGPETPSSPPSQLTPFQLGRYLEYCSELLSLIGKVLVLYVQDNDDEVVLDAADDIEDLTNGLSRKIWQKIMLVHALGAPAAGAHPPYPIMESERVATSKP